MYLSVDYSSHCKIFDETIYCVSVWCAEKL